MMIVLAWLLLGFSAYVAFMNLWGSFGAIVRRRRGKPRGYSNGGLLSLIAACLAWLLGREAFGWWAFLPTALDPGTWIMLALPAVILREFRK